MITCANRIRLINLDFENYKLLPQYSFSFLKRERAGIAQPIITTKKMQLGTLVDNILTSGPVDMAHELFTAAQSIAYKLSKEFNWLLPHIEKQVSYTGELIYDNFVLPVKGRPDFDLFNRLIIDLKICHSKNWKSVVDFMDYKSQQYNYSKLANVQQAYLMIYCKPQKETIIHELDVTGNNSFWQEKIIKFGSLCNKS